MAATASASAAFPPVATGGDLEDSNISSPLSEVDDKDANDDDIEHMHLDREHLSLGPEETRATDHGGSDSDSALSDAGSDVNSEANDTEAETLRLYDTPQAQRHRDVGIERFNDAEPFEHTPSKLRRAFINGDDDSASAFGSDSHSHRDEDEEDDEDEENDDHELPTKPVMVIVKTEEDARRDSQERKRKRSAAAEQSDMEQPVRKRTGSISAADGDGDDHLAVEEDDATPAANLPSGVPSPGDEEASATNQDTPQDDEIPEVSRKTKRSGSKRKNVIADDADSESQAEVRDEQNDTAVEDEPEADHAEEEAEPEADEETDAAARNLEECKFRCFLEIHSACFIQVLIGDQWRRSKLPTEIGPRSKKCLVFSEIGKLKTPLHACYDNSLTLVPDFTKTGYRDSRKKNSRCMPQSLHTLNISI